MMAARDQREPRRGDAEFSSRAPTGGPGRQLLLGAGAASLLAIGGLAGYAFAQAVSGEREAPDNPVLTEAVELRQPVHDHADLAPVRNLRRAVLTDRSARPDVA